MVELLLDKGADIKAKTDTESTPLHYASEWGHVDVAKLLHDKGADIEARNSHGSTPLHWASGKLLLKQGANMNVTSRNMPAPTPLHSASYEGHVYVVKLLLNKGADINAKAYGETPLDVAKAHDREGCSSFGKGSFSRR